MAVFVVAAALSLGASALLVTRLERIGERVGLTEALLGLVAALAADAPEVTSAVTAISRGQGSVGVGIIFGATAFSLATLLGVAALVAGRIDFHRRVAVFEGIVALWMVAASGAVILGWIPAPLGLLAALLVLVPYVIVSAVRRRALRGLPVSRRWLSWLIGALGEEETELAAAIRPKRGRPVDVVVAGVALVVVVVASVVMEHTATAIGDRRGVSSIVVGALILAVVASLPNAVAGIYLAQRGRGSATLSVALNSNTLNVVLGFLLPAAVAGFIAGAPGTTLTLAAYASLTALTLTLAFAGRGLGRGAGAVIVAGYAIFVVRLLML
jgi:cation:H+ antiporter